MADLSPAARAVLHTFASAPINSRSGSRLAIAAALRAAADLVAPEDYLSYTGYAEWDAGMEARNDAIRENLLGLANELDPPNS